MQYVVMEEPRHPVSSFDYPGTFPDFDKWFRSENACLEYIGKLRWPKGLGYTSYCDAHDDLAYLLEGITIMKRLKRVIV